jgi:hypothetical protein
VATLELRPRTATEIIDASFQLLRANYVPLVTLSVATQLPLLVVRILLPRLSTGFAAGQSEFLRGITATEIALVVVGGAVLVLLAVVAQNAVLVAASQVYLGQAIDAGAALRRALVRFLPLIAAVLLFFAGFGVIAGVLVIPAVAVARTAGFVALFFFGMYTMFRCASLSAVVVLEDGGPWRAITRAWELGGGQVLHILATILLSLLIYMGVAIVGLVIVGVIGLAVHAITDPSVSAVFQSAVSALIYPLVMAITVVLYYDLRIRHEGFDVEQMSRALATA